MLKMQTQIDFHLHMNIVHFKASMFGKFKLYDCIFILFMTQIMPFIL